MDENFSHVQKAKRDLLLKIEVANRRHDVEYVVQTLKSADMVVVSRAIRGSGWLVVDEQYSHIVEPHFLHDQLLPHMTFGAAAKFLSHIRMHLKNLERIHKFYNYYEKVDLDKALEWLPYCSSEFIANKITINLFNNLCQKYLLEIEIVVRIRKAISKLDSDVLKDLMLSTWKDTNDIAIRAVVFNLTFTRLSIEAVMSKSENLWQLLVFFIDDLSNEDDPAIYVLLGNIEKVPTSFRSKFCMKAYKILRAVTMNAKREKILNSIITSAAALMDTIDQDFATTILLDYIETWLVKIKCFSYKDVPIYKHASIIKRVISNYIISCKTESDQKFRLETVIRPWLRQVFSMWNITVDNENVIESYFRQCLHSIFETMAECFAKKNAYILPFYVFKCIKEELEAELPPHVHYDHILHLRLAMCYTVCYNKVKNTFPDLSQDVECNDIVLRERQKELWQKIGPLFAEECVKMLKQDKNTYFNSIQPVFICNISEFIATVKSYEVISYDFEKALIKHSDIVGPLLAIGVLPTKFHNSEDEKLLQEVHAMINNCTSMEVKLHYNNKYNDNPVVYRISPKYK